MKNYPINKYLEGASPIAFGCMGLGGGWSNEPAGSKEVDQAHQAIDASLESGINFFDHADIYTLGKAEQVFGEVLKERPSLRSQMYIQSKCAIRFDDENAPKRYDFSPEWIERSVDNILKRLNVEYIYILLLHRPDPLMEPEEVAETLKSLKLSGKVRHFGGSNMHQHQLTFLQKHLGTPLVANQIEVSLNRLGWVDEGVYAGNPEGRDINFTAGTLEYCRENDVQIQSWGSLCQGLFSGRDVSNEAPKVKATATLVGKLAEKYQVSQEAIVLGWLMRHPAKIQPVIGTTNPARTKACAEASSIKLSREDWYSLYVSSRGEELP